MNFNNLNMKGYTILFLGASIVFTLSFLSCKYEHQKVVKYDNVSFKLEKYRDEQNGFSIEYPVDWKRVDGNQDIVFAVKMINDSSDQSFQNTIHITKLADLKNSSVNLNDVVEASIKDMANSFEGFRVTKKGSLNINNNSAANVQCDFQANNEAITSLIYFVQTSNNIYLIGLSGKSNGFGKYEEIYKYIAKTFISGPVNNFV